MDEKQQKLILDELRLCLNQISLELDAAAKAAAQAAGALPSETQTWPPVQQLYTRLDEANHLVSQFKQKINAAIEQGAKPR